MKFKGISSDSFGEVSFSHFENVGYIDDTRGHFSRVSGECSWHGWCCGNMLASHHCGPSGSNLISVVRPRKDLECVVYSPGLGSFIKAKMI
jgi:hypothetical protein